MLYKPQKYATVKCKISVGFPSTHEDVSEIKSKKRMFNIEVDVLGEAIRHDNETSSRKV